MGQIVTLERFVWRRCGGNCYREGVDITLHFENIAPLGIRTFWSGLEDKQFERKED